MSNARRNAEGLHDRQSWRVIDDLPRAHCIDPAELDAIEAFLMPQLNAILSGETSERLRAPSRADSQAPQYLR
jgi:hypothetical protein